MESGKVSLQPLPPDQAMKAFAFWSYFLWADQG